MKHDNFEADYTNWSQQAELLNQKLSPFANAPFDMDAPNWQEKLAHLSHPADTAGLRAEIETLFGDIVDRFEGYDEVQRQHIIDMLANYDALLWSAVIDADINTQDGFRKHMILFVLHDQGKDTRDAMLALETYFAEAEKMKIDARSIFKEMALLYSTNDKFGWGSTRDLFLRYLK